MTGYAVKIYFKDGKELEIQAVSHSFQNDGTLFDVSAETGEGFVITVAETKYIQFSKEVKEYLKPTDKV